MSPRERVGKQLQRKYVVLRPLCTPVCLLGASLVLALGGALAALFWADIFQHVVAASLRLTPDSFRFLVWRDTPVPNYIEFYFFNWTNPEHFQELGTKPRFQELGPYRFLETRTKTDVVWNDNNTISYTQERKWFFDPQNSNGSLSDEITTINIIALSAAYVLRDWNYYLLLPFNQILKSNSISITHPVSEFLFDGFEDPLINLGRLGSMFDKAIQMPDDRFGWFYKRNASRLVDGVFNMATGASDLSQTGVLKQWNYRNRTEHYPGACGEVKGYTGEVFPPQRRKNETLELYFQDVCRTMLFQYSGEALVGDIPSYQYTASPMNLDNGTLDPGNACYCGGHCVPGGALNVSACKLGAPAFVSYPHFYQADPYYLALVDGLKPDPDKHSFHIFVEPKTGIPIDMFARLQVNLLVQPYKALTLLANLPKVFFPMMWFQQRIRATPELATTLQRLLLLSPLGLVGAGAVFTLGLCLFLSVAYTRCCRGYSPRTANKQVIEVTSPLMSQPSEASAAQAAQAARGYAI